MAKLRNAVLAIVLATGGVGCTTFCDECDDFPIPGGPGGYALMPGSYAGGPLSTAPETPPTGSPILAPGTSLPNRPAISTPGGGSGPTPPTAPAATPGQNTGANPPAPDAASTTPFPSSRVATSNFTPPSPSISPTGGLPDPTPSTHRTP